LHGDCPAAPGRMSWKLPVVEASIWCWAAGQLGPLGHGSVGDPTEILIDLRILVPERWALTPPIAIPINSPQGKPISFRGDGPGWGKLLFAAISEERVKWGSI
jgi:hypothetical protein